MSRTLLLRLRAAPPARWVASGPYPTHRVAAYTAFDLYASYALQSLFGTTSLAGGVRDLFDAAPPAVYDSFLTYADPTYDFVGRYVYGRLAHKF